MESVHNEGTPPPLCRIFSPQKVYGMGWYSPIPLTPSPPPFGDGSGEKFAAGAIFGILGLWIMGGTHSPPPILYFIVYITVCRGWVGVSVMYTIEDHHLHLGGGASARQDSASAREDKILPST